MTTQRLPFPVPDERAHLFVDSYADMHDLVEDLVVPDGVPEAAATVLRTARELLRQSYYCYEFSTVAVMRVRPASCCASPTTATSSPPWRSCTL
ncbi:hypothetical protein [Streptomyces cadmiisoli]|uniref:hypothetical protein n=1 Tax=Streptomyces cadmiisoli TaxID=2184053 RepID=UPI003D7252F0